MTAFPSFTAFFEAIYDVPPFPWQVRLAEEVLTRGWPDLLDLPTGVGKTSALDIALFALAAAPERMPRRTLLVVDRRIVVDQGADHARGLLNKFRDVHAKPAARAIADRLRSLWDASADSDPFAVAVLRGGMPRDNDWARRPDQPCSACRRWIRSARGCSFEDTGSGPARLRFKRGCSATTP